MTDYKKQQQDKDNQKKFDTQKQQQQKTGQHTAPMNTPTTGKPAHPEHGHTTDKNKTKPTGGKF
jgi:hypothetical protein